MVLADTRDPNSLSSKLRKKRDVKLKLLINSIFTSQNSVRIIDIGGTLGYWERVGFNFLRQNNVECTLVNLHASELDDLGEHTDIFQTMVGNGCNLHDVMDDQFDLAHSNSVVEHVYGWSNMKLFAKELQRVSKAIYVQTPYFWFPFDPHFYKMPFFHWLPRPLRTMLLMRFALAYRGRIDNIDEARSVVDGAVLLDGREMKFLFHDATLTYEKFCGFRKSIIATKDWSKTS